MTPLECTRQPANAQDLKNPLDIHQLNGGQLPLRYLEHRITRDFKVPLSADDLEMENGWRCIPVPPTDDPDWFVVDDSRDYKTVWGRWHEIGGPS